MDADILDNLKAIGYNGPMVDGDKLNAAVKVGVKDEQFRLLIVDLCGQLKVLLNLDESVQNVTENEDTSGFVMEICSLLKELNCPYEKLVEGPVTDRWGNETQRLTLLYFLVTELMAARLLNKSQQAAVLKSKATDPAKDLKSVLITLKFPRPPDNITAQDLFQKVETNLHEMKKTVPPVLWGKPLLKGLLSPNQIKSLMDVFSEMRQEYKLRREMLLKRLDVTVQSFEWSESAKGKRNEIGEQFIEKRRSLLAEPDVHVADVFAAREDLAIIEKTSSSTARKNTKSSVHKIIIGGVPDRGGRPSEQAAPPPEMPSWQKDRAQGGGGGGGGGRGGHFSRGGGRVQGGWNQHDDRTDSRPRSDNHDDRRGDYNDRRGDFNDRRGHGGRGRGKYR